MLDSNLLVERDDDLGDVPVVVQVPVRALEHAAYGRHRHCLDSIADERLDAAEIRLRTAHPQPRNLHSIEEGGLELGEVADEVCIGGAALDLRDLEAVVLSSAVLNRLVLIEIDRLGEVREVVPDAGFALEVSLDVSRPLTFC